MLPSGWTLLFVSRSHPLWRCRADCGWSRRPRPSTGWRRQRLCAPRTPSSASPVAQTHALSYTRVHVPPQSTLLKTHRKVCQTRAAHHYGVWMECRRTSVPTRFHILVSQSSLFNKYVDKMCLSCRRSDCSVPKHLSETFPGFFLVWICCLC